MAKKGKKPAIQRMLRKDPTPLHEIDSQSSQAPEQQEVAKTFVKDTIERLSEMQTEAAIDPAEEGRGSVRDFTRDPTVNLIRGPSGQLTEGAQLRLHQNKDLPRGAELPSQRNIDAMEVDPPEIPDPHIIDVVADQTTANKANDLSNSISDSEIRTRIAVLRKQKKRAELKVKLEHLECEKAGRFVDKRN